MTKRILVMNLTRMGDLIQSTPLITGLRKKYINTEITLVVSSDFKNIASRIPHVDNVLVFNLRQFDFKNDRGELKSWIEIYNYLKFFLDKIKQENFHEAYNLSHSTLSALMLTYLNIEKTFGFLCNDTGDRITLHPWLQYFGVEPFNRLLNPFNLVDIYLHAGEVDNYINQVSLKNDPSEKKIIEPILDDLKNIEGEIVIGFQIGSSLEGRRWPAKSFAKLGDLLCSRMNAKVLMFGVESEFELVSEVMAEMEMAHRAINLAGKTDISKLVGLLKECCYLVTNDTGTMHLAAALDTRIVGLFFAHANPIETGPYASGNIIFQARISCAPCSYGVTCNDVVCVNKVEPDDIFKIMFAHHINGIWEVPNVLKNVDQLNIYETGFGDDGLLEMRPLIRRFPEKYDFFRLAYRRLWLDSLDKSGTVINEVNKMLFELSKTASSWFKKINSSQLLESFQDEFQALKILNKLCTKGIFIMEAIESEIKREDSQHEKLKILGDETSEIDQKINQIGLTHPALKPLSDLFGKRKENFCGDDIQLLANEAKQCYKQLFYEGSRLDYILKYLFKNINFQDYKPIELSLSNSVD